MYRKKFIEGRLAALAKSRFRSSFHLREKERKIVAEKGISVIREHAVALIAQRLAPAYPANDGRQTPMKNHPVFIAQHATATCCRGCLSKWHGIPNGRELTDEEKEYVVDMILAWIQKE